MKTKKTIIIGLFIVAVAAVALFRPLRRWFAGPQPITSVSSSASSTEEGKKTKPEPYYTCPMHPSVKQKGPGQCPLCGMDLTKVMPDDEKSGVIVIDAQRRQKTGIRTAEVVRRSISKHVRALGKVTYDERHLADITLKVRGWISNLAVNVTGQPVRAGQRLFDLYSPELYAAQTEFLQLTQRNAALLQAARQRLRLWGLSDAQIDALQKTGKASEHQPFVSPASGYVIEKNVVEGAAVEPGMRLYRIAALNTVWVDAEVFATDLQSIRVGQSADITTANNNSNGVAAKGRVNYIYPYVNASTRTNRVRLELKNPKLALLPDMYVDVQFEIDLGERLVVPIEAVIYTGPRRLVFVDLGQGRLKPQVVHTGVRTDEVVEVLHGLSEGQSVVSSGNFLVSAESRLRNAVGHWDAEGESAPAEDGRHDH